MLQQLCVFKIHFKGVIWIFDFSLCNFLRKYYGGENWVLVLLKDGCELLEGDPWAHERKTGEF
jgi:hypothetical protein